MAQRGIREFHAKRMLARHLPEYLGSNFGYEGQIALVDKNTDWDVLIQENPWLNNNRLVTKPDQLFGKRGKHGLLLIDRKIEEVKAWINEKMNTQATIGPVTDKLTTFIIEPCVEHDEEYYVAIKSTVDGDTLYFSTKGGMDIEEVWDTVVEINIPANANIDKLDIESTLPAEVAGTKRAAVAKYIVGLLKFYGELHYAYLEINPFAVKGENIFPLDMVARIDDTASYLCAPEWGEDLEFPSPFGRIMTKEEAFVAELDEKTGASLKLTVLNPEGRIWTLVAGGGASVIYADTIVDLGFKDELANYGEYSGDPNKEMTYLYTKTVLDLMTRTEHEEGKILLIGGGIANFTDIAKTFAGIVLALEEFRSKLISCNVKIYIRRGGPNYQEGLRLMRKLGKTLGVPIKVFGPETHMTKIVSMGLA